MIILNATERFLAHDIFLIVQCLSYHFLAFAFLSDSTRSCFLVYDPTESRLRVILTVAQIRITAADYLTFGQNDKFVLIPDTDRPEH